MGGGSQYRAYMYTRTETWRECPDSLLPNSFIAPSSGSDERMAGLQHVNKFNSNHMLFCNK